MLSIHRKLFLALKKSQYVKNHSTSGSLHLVKKSTGTISDSLTPYHYLENPEGSTLRTALDFKKLKIIYILLRYILFCYD